MSWSLIFSGEDYGDLRQTLLSAAPNESGAILLCNPSFGQRLLVAAVLVPGAEDIAAQTPLRIDFAPAFVARAVKAARASGQAVVLVHTHPLSDQPEFSSIDDATEERLIPAIAARAPGHPHGSLVLGRQGFCGRIYVNSKPEALGRVFEVGTNLRVHGARVDNVIAEIHDRNVRALGQAGQALLAASTIGIVGLGGLGAIVAEQLAHLGLGRFVLVDDDRVAETNLNRLVGASPADVGRLKVDVARDHINRITGGKAKVVAVDGNVLDSSAASPLFDCDLIVNGTDTHGSRALLNQLAYQHWLPVIDLGVRIDAAEGQMAAMAGRVQLLAPGMACLQCEALLDPEAIRRDLMSEAARAADPYIVGEATPQPSVISLNGLVASLGVTTMLAVITGLPVRPRRVNYRVAESMVRGVSSPPDPQCVVCGAGNAFGQGSRWPLFWRGQA